MTERGMVAEGRTLVRGLIETSFCVAALHDKPAEFLELFRDDSEGSRRLQGKFIAAQRMIDDDATLDRLNAAMAELGNVRPMNIKALAEMGPLLKQYLAYQRLSDDSAHTSARALNKHVKKVGEGWQYRWGAGSKEENATTLHHAVLAGIGIGVGVTQILDDRANNEQLGDISNRFKALPDVDVI